MENLRCTVSNCVYNDKDNHLCTAEHISIFTNEAGLANSSAETSCRTFKPRSTYRNVGFK